MVTPIFTRIAIVGFGLIGASLALAVKRQWPSAVVIGIDGKPIADAAMRMHAADSAGDSLAAVADAALIVLAAPVRQNIAILRELPKVVPGDAVVTDVGGTKAETVTAARELPERLRFVGGHPLAGAARGGIDGASADLFEGRPWVLTPEATTNADAVTRIRGFVEAIGAHPVELTPAEHDRIVAYLSHLPQLAVTALMHVVGESVGADGLALAGSGLRDTTRLASSPPGIWRDIAATNREHVAAALDGLIDVLRRLKAAAQQPEPAFDDVFASAARWKQQLEER